MKLEFVDNLRLAHPFVKGFNRVVRCASEEEARAILLGQPPASPDAEGAEDDPATAAAENVAAPHKVYFTAFFVGLAVRPKDRTPPCPHSSFEPSINFLSLPSSR